LGDAAMLELSKHQESAIIDTYNNLLVVKYIRKAVFLYMVALDTWAVFRFLIVA
jgi:hypothetical protein